jgi:glycosyltransferase involved in cell wall biosynthesis
MSSPSAPKPPRVSIGLPVYNGEKYLRAAIDSILAQTFVDFELIISDNASNDGTEIICRNYSAQDRRILYVRNACNIGAAPNYNQTFDLSKGEYFKWIAHDDVLSPDYLARCVEALDANADAVLCQSLIRYINEHGQEICIYDSPLDDATSIRSSDRFAAVILLPHPCNEFFSLIRRKMLIGSLLHGHFHGGDRALLAELALRGRFLRLDEPLSMMREHPNRYTRVMTRPKDRLAWHDMRAPGRYSLPTFRLYFEYWRIVSRNIDSLTDRIPCYNHLLRWWTVNWNWLRMPVDMAALIAPDIVTAAERAKYRMFGPPPGPFQRAKG